MDKIRQYDTQNLKIGNLWRQNWQKLILIFLMLAFIDNELSIHIIDLKNRLTQSISLRQPYFPLFIGAE